jgi:hypothetical protein
MHASAKHLQSQSSNVLPRLVVSQQIAHLTSLNEHQKQVLELALKYQLVTDQTNLILVHVREEDKKAEGLPELSRVNHMLAAGWGGVGSVEESIAYCRTTTASDVNYSILNYDVPAFLRKSPPSSERVSVNKSQKTTSLVILQTFEASAQKVFAQQRFVGNLESLELPDELIRLLDNLTVILGARAKAWAVVLQCLAESMTDQITLSRQTERLLRQMLKDIDPFVLEELKQTWTAKIGALINHEVTLKLGGMGDLNIPAFLRRQAD